MSFMVNITKMSLENGVMGLPVDVCRNWNALTSIPGKLIYAGRECPITFSPKHKRKPSDDVVQQELGSLQLMIPFNFPS